MERETKQQELDRANWNALRHGDTGAFSSLYNSYSKLLLSYGRKVNGNRQLVADSVQELFTYLWTRREYLGDTASVRFYLIKSLRTIIIKENNKSKKVELIHSENIIDGHNHRENEMINEENNAERNNLLKKALQMLSKREQEILYLKYFAGSTHEEIAELLDIKYQSVKNVAASGIKKLKEYFGAANANMFISICLLYIM